MGRVRTPIRITLSLVAAAAVVLFAPASASAATLFSNTNPITINDNGRASPFPSSIPVSGLRGPIAEISVTLKKLSHTYPADLDVLLISPWGDTAVVMSDACGSDDLVRADIFFSDRAATEMPTLGPCTSPIYKPTDIFRLEPLDPFPPGPHRPSFLQFRDENPNGTWSLYVNDDKATGTGEIEVGWSIAIETAPADALVPGSGTEGVASSYPSSTTVSGETGVVRDVNVRLDGIVHENPDDLDMLLVGPMGQRVVLMSDACGSVAASTATWIWDDQAALKAPDDGDLRCPRGPTQFQPTDHAPGDAWPAPAPPGPYATALSAFNGTDPNGDWKLYVNDDAPGGTGFFSKRVSISVTTGPKAPVAFTESAVDVPEGATRSLTLKRTAESLGPGAVTVTTQPASATSGTDFTPVATTVEFAAGETEKTVPVTTLTDGAAEPGEAFAVTLSAPTGDAALGTQSSVAVTIPAGEGDGGLRGDRTNPIVTVVPGKKLGRGGHVKLRVRCSEACNGRIVLFSTKKVRTSRKGTPRKLTLGSAAFRIPRAGSTTLKVKLPAKGRAALRLAKRVPITAAATATDAAGNRGVGTARTMLRR